MTITHEDGLASRFPFRSVKSRNEAGGTQISSSIFIKKTYNNRISVIKFMMRIVGLFTSFDFY